MQLFALKAEARENLGKKATKALRAQGLIPVVLNGGSIVELPFNGTLAAGEKLVAGSCPQTHLHSRHLRG